MSANKNPSSSSLNLPSLTLQEQDLYDINSVFKLLSDSGDQKITIDSLHEIYNQYNASDKYKDDITIQNGMKRFKEELLDIKPKDKSTKDQANENDTDEEEEDFITEDMFQKGIENFLTQIHVSDKKATILQSIEHSCVELANHNHRLFMEMLDLPINALKEDDINTLFQIINNSHPTLSSTTS